MYFRPQETWLSAEGAPVQWSNNNRMEQPIRLWTTLTIIFQINHSHLKAKFIRLIFRWGWWLWVVVTIKYPKKRSAIQKTHKLDVATHFYLVRNTKISFIYCCCSGGWLLLRRWVFILCAKDSISDCSGKAKDCRRTTEETGKSFLTWSWSQSYKIFLLSNIGQGRINHKAD